MEAGPPSSTARPACQCKLRRGFHPGYWTKNNTEVGGEETHRRHPTLLCKCRVAGVLRKVGVRSEDGLITGRPIGMPRTRRLRIRSGTPHLCAHLQPGFDASCWFVVVFLSRISELYLVQLLAYQGMPGPASTGWEGGGASTTQWARSLKCHHGFGQAFAITKVIAVSWVCVFLHSEDTQ